MYKLSRVLFTLLVASIFVLGSAAYAAELQRGNVEVAGFGGGLLLNEGGGTRPAVGTGVAVAVTSRLLIYGQYLNIRLGSGSFVDPAEYTGYTITGNTVKGSADAIQTGIHYSLPTASQKVVPYIIGGLAVVTSKGSGVVTYQWKSYNYTYTYTDNYADESYTGLGVEGGVGVRIYLNDNLGFRPEFKYGVYYMSDLITYKAATLTAGIFYQFGRK
jgi:hypothetical protein